MQVLLTFWRNLSKSDDIFNYYIAAAGAVDRELLYIEWGNFFPPQQQQQQQQQQQEEEEEEEEQQQEHTTRT